MDPQNVKETTNTEHKQQIRAGALQGPLSLLLSENSGELQWLRQELKGMPNPKFAETLIQCDEYLDGFARMEFLAEQPYLIMRAALAQDLGTIGLFGKAIVHAETLWDGMLAIQDGMRYVQSSSEIHYRLRHGRVRVTYSHRLGNGREAVPDIQYTIALFCNLLREAKWSSQSDLIIGYPEAKPAHLALFPEALMVKNAPCGFLDFNDNMLRSPLSRTDPLWSAISSSVLMKFDADAPEDPTTCEMVKEIQAASLRHNQSPIKMLRVAELLGLPARTMQAYLNAEGSSFAEVRNDTLHREAQRELLAGRSISETSEMLGFTHRQSFSEAFSKWEGCAPSIFASRGHL